MKMKILYKIAVALLLLPMVAEGAKPAPRPMAGAALSRADSTSRALATIWAESMNPMISSTFQADSSRRAYLEGVEQSFSIDPSRSAYYRGVLEGLQLVERVKTMGQMGLEVNLNNFQKDLMTALNGGNLGFASAEEANGFINHTIAGMMPPDTVSLAAEQAFLDKQFKREGVVKFDNGLMFEVLKEGEGAYPAMTDTVSVMYTGRLSDGTVFDQTEEPISFSVDGVVAGMSDGLLHMKPGGRYRLFIPSTLGYGPEGIPGVIPGNAVLDFTVDLLDVVRATDKSK